jgi:hypothetical protein
MYVAFFVSELFVVSLDLSLAQPLCNALAMLFTAITSQFLGERPLDWSCTFLSLFSFCFFRQYSERFSPWMRPCTCWRLFVSFKPVIVQNVRLERKKTQKKYISICMKNFVSKIVVPFPSCCARGAEYSSTAKRGQSGRI